MISSPCANVFSTKKSSQQKRNADEGSVAAALAFVALMVAALVPLAAVVARRVGDVTGDFVAAEDRPAGEENDDAAAETEPNEPNEPNETNGGRDDVDVDADVDVDLEPSDDRVSSRVGRRRPIAFVELLSRPKFVAALGVLTAARTARSPRKTARCALFSDLSTRADGATSELRRGERKSAAG